MLICVSVSHRNAGFDLLDRLAASTADTKASDLIEGATHGAVLLSTCNRVEAYLDVVSGAEGPEAERVVERLAAAVAPDGEVVIGNATIAVGADALRHLFSVASGLESLAVGEDEIAGQVRRAYASARGAGATTPALDQAFQRASKVSRDVRAATALGRQGRSLVQFALDLAGHRVTDWRSTRVLVVGTGNYAATTITSLRALGVVDIAVYSQTGRAEAFASRYGLVARRGLPEAIAAAEVVVTCTRAYTVTAADVPLDGERRLVIDLGMPRNVDAAVGDVPGVELLDMQLIAMHAKLPELAPESAAQEIVRSAAGRHEAERRAAPAIVALRQHVFDALDAEIARAERRAGDPEAAALAAESLRHLAGMLLHAPSRLAREAATSGRIEEFEAALATVLGVQVDDGDAHGVTPLHRAASEQVERTGTGSQAPGDGAARGAG